MNRNYTSWLLGLAIISLLLALPVQGRAPDTTVTHAMFTPTPDATIPPPPPLLSTDEHEPLPLRPEPPLPPGMEFRERFPPLYAGIDELDMELMNVTQSDPPYRYFQFAIGAQAPVGAFNYPDAVAAAPDGSVYVADVNNHRIQHFGATGFLLNTWGSIGSGEGKLNCPSGIAVAANGTVYVADSGNNRIQWFSATGEYLGQWGVYGVGDGRFNWPAGIVIGPDNTVYVADQWNNRIQRFTATGTFLNKWGSNGNADGQFVEPYGVATTADGTVYVADSGNHRIQYFSPTGDYLGQWGYYGSNNGQFNWPRRVAVASNNTVYVADTDNNRIQYFGATGAYLGKWGSYGANNGQFASPRGVVVTADGTVYVGDSNNHRIQRFTQTGEYLGKWGTRGRDEGQLTTPFGIAVAGDGTLYIADTDNYRIQQFSAVGVYLSEWGTYGSGNGQFRWPSGIAIASNGTIYVADRHQSRIQRFTSSGTYLGQWGSPGPDDGQFSGPMGIAVAPDNTVYVADTWNQRIQRFNATGVFLGKWGSEGSDDGQFRWPYGVTVDSSGTVYVADEWNNRIQRFTATGGYLGQWGSLGIGDGRFRLPWGVTAAPDGTIYVADRLNYRIQRFTNSGTYLGKWGISGSSEAQFNQPMDIAVAVDGTAYVVDHRNDRIQVFHTTNPETWRGEYFGNRWLAERPPLIRDENEIDFEWATGSPDPVIPAELFSSRWQRYVHLDKTGLYRFTLLIDDGGRLWVDDQLLIEEWRHPQRATFSETLYLEAGYHRVRLEHYEYQGWAAAALDIEYIDTTSPESSASSPAYATTAPITVSWTASDDYSGVAFTRLWVKFGSDGVWSNTGLTQAGTSGIFDYTPASGDGIYYFAAVATDNAGNVEAAPTGEGETNTMYDTVAPSSVTSSPQYANAAIVVNWTASDATSGVDFTRLWVKFGSDGVWTSTTLTQTGNAGVFSYTPTGGDGIYYFATVATDNAGNVEATPVGDGDSNTLVDTVLPLSSASSPAYTNTSPIAIFWTASDDDSGVAATTLWARVGSGGVWASTGLTQAGTSGSFAYPPTGGDGLYYFATVATDNAGNVEATPTGDGDTSTLYDATAPNSTASSLAYTNASPVTVSWTASDATSGVALTTLWAKFGSGGVWASTGLTQTGTVGGFDYTPASGDGAYYFATVATDNVGNVEATPTGDGDTSTVYDTVAPSSVTSSPQYANAAIAVNWTASDATSGVAFTQLWVKFGSDGVWTSTTLTQTGNAGVFSYTPPGGDGLYYFATVATDNAGNVEATPVGDGDSSTLLDTVAPVSNASSPGYANTTIAVNWVANDAASGVAVTRLWVKVGSGGVWVSAGLIQSGTSGTFNYTPTGGDGVYYFAAVATDNAGNVEATPTGDGDTSTLYDATAPSSTASSIAYTNASPIPVSWTANDATSGVALTTLWAKFGSGGVWASTGLTQTGTSGSFSYTPPSGDGAYYFATVATDNVGNVEATPTANGDTSTVYDTVAPSSTASSPEYTNTAIAVTWTASDATSGVASTQLWVKFGSDGVWTSSGSPQSGTAGSFNFTPSSGDGRYYFATVATDRAGNVAGNPTGDGDSHTLYDVTRPESQVHVPELENAKTVSLPWTASDNLSGVSNTTLWVKFGALGVWTETDLAQSGTAGTFEYTFTQGEGLYYFATVATDHAGNQESTPAGAGDGGCEYRLYRVYLPATLRDYVQYFKGPWEVEPNNEYWQANGPLLSGQDYNGYPNDAKDYFSIYTRQAGEITVDLTGHIGEGVQLLLWHGAPRSDYSNLVGTRNASPYRITYTGPAGWYYVYIYTAGGYNTTTPYTLRVTYPQ